MTLFGQRIVDADLESLKFSAVHGCAGGGGRLDSVIVDEAEAARPFAFAVDHQFDLFDVSIMGKLPLQPLLGGLETEPKNSKTFRWLGILTLHKRVGGGRRPVVVAMSLTLHMRVGVGRRPVVTTLSLTLHMRVGGGRRPVVVAMS